MKISLHVVLNLVLVVLLSGCNEPRIEINEIKLNNSYNITLRGVETAQIQVNNISEDGIYGSGVFIDINKVLEVYVYNDSWLRGVMLTCVVISIFISFGV